MRRGLLRALRPAHAPAPERGAAGAGASPCAWGARHSGGGAAAALATSSGRELGSAPGGRELGSAPGVGRVHLRTADKVRPHHYA